jgi:dihydropteroate synthase
MNLSGTFETMHKQKAIADILSEVRGGFRWSLEKATSLGVKKENIALDIGIGFGKTFAQNLELLAELNQICREFADFPVLVGTSRKSFIGKILGDAPPNQRIYGTAASVAIAVFNGAKIVRVHDVRAAVETVRVAEAIKNGQNRQDAADKS